jgi:predicted ATPase
MLTKLRFKNFKAWTDSEEIRLAPLTVLFGTNSAGKTSIPQLLLLLKQTAASSDRKGALQFGDSRTLVDLGTYADMVYGHDTDKPVEIELEWSLREPLVVKDQVNNREYRGDSLSFRVSIQADKLQQPSVVSLEYQLRRDGAADLDVCMRKQPQASKFELASERYRFTRHPGRAWSLPKPVRFYGFPHEATAYYQNTAFLADLVLEMEHMLGSLYYVGPLREFPRRLYLWSGEVPDHVGVRGDRSVEAILAADKRRFNWKAKQRTKTLSELVAHRLQSMNLIQNFEVKALGKHRKEYEVLVKTHARLPDVKLTDVGFGISQVLPVIVECFYVPRRSIVIFEQPEIHLHPKVQADLADLFIDAIRAREDGVSRDCQFLIESHSEHFLRRLQRRIAEDELPKDNAALYFVHTEDERARIQELLVDDYGNIQNWPTGFFGDEMADLVARTEAQAQRMAQERSK